MKPAPAVVPTVDLAHRARLAVVRLENALANDPLGLNETSRTAVVRELASIKQSLVEAPIAPDCSVVSRLPAEWLEQRWRAVMELPQIPERVVVAQDGHNKFRGPLPGWYPYFNDLGTVHKASFGIGWTRFEGWALEGPALYSLKSALGTLPAGSTPPDHWKPHLVDLTQDRDSVAAFGFVRQARSVELWRRHSSVLPRETMKWAVRIHKFGMARLEAGARLLADSDRWKVRADVTFEAAGRHTRCRVGSCTGIDQADVLTAVNVQRLCILLLGILSGKSVAGTDWHGLPYVRLERELQEKGLSDREPAADAGAWDQVVAGLRSWMKSNRQEEHDHIRVLTHVPFGCRWQPKRHVLTALAPTLEAGDAQTVLRAFDRSQPISPCWFVIADEIDGPTAYRMVNHVWRVGEECDSGDQGPGVAVVSVVSYDAMPLRPPRGVALARCDDVLSAMLPSLSILDPFLSLGWLAARSIHHIA